MQRGIESLIIAYNKANAKLINGDQNRLQLMSQSYYFALPQPPPSLRNGTVELELEEGHPTISAPYCRPFAVHLSDCAWSFVLTLQYSGGRAQPAREPQITPSTTDQRRSSPSLVGASRLAQTRASAVGRGTEGGTPQNFGEGFEDQQSCCCDQVHPPSRLQPPPAGADDPKGG